LFFIISKGILTEALEIDQYMWAILSALSTTDTEEVSIDSAANWKAIKMVTGIKMEEDIDTKRLNKVNSPGSTTLPTWDNSQAMSPYMFPDMNTIASGSMMGQK